MTRFCSIYYYFIWKYKSFMLYVEKQARILSWNFFFKSQLEDHFQSHNTPRQQSRKRICFEAIHENSIINIITFVNSVLKKFLKTLSQRLRFSWIYYIQNVYDVVTDNEKTKFRFIKMDCFFFVFLLSFPVQLIYSLPLFETLISFSNLIFFADSVI